MRLLDRLVLLALSPSRCLLLALLELVSHLARDLEQLLILHLKLVDRAEGDEVGGDDRVGVANLFRSSQDGSLVLVKLVRIALDRRVLLRREHTRQGANLTAEIGELLRKDGVVGREAANVEAERFGAALGSVAVGEGLGELRSEVGGFG